MRRVLSVFVAVLMLAAPLAGCSQFQSHTEIEALNEAKATGSPFTQRLTAEYRSYVRAKQRALDYSDANHFARKGLMAAQGKVVMPEPLSNWHLDDRSARDLRTARNELLGLLNGGGRSQASVEAALAQVKFDCWMEQEEQNWASPRAPVCRTEYQKALADLKKRLGDALPKSEKMGDPVPAKKMPPAPVVQAHDMAAPVVDPNAFRTGLDEGMFLVFFDFDKSQLNATGLEVISAVAEQAQKRNDLRAIKLIGHTDSSGSDKYNQRLSQRRADAVRAALAERGVSVDLLETSARGESDPMVQTPNNTREPANRRVEVRFE